MSVEAKLKAFIEKTSFSDRVRDLGYDQSLLDAGIIDSTGVLALVSYIEDEFKVEIADDEIIPENFESISRIAAFIDSKRGSAR